MRIVVSDNHPQRLTELRRVLLGEGLTCDSADAVDFDSLPARLAEVQPEFVLIHCDSTQEDCFAALRMANSVTAAPILACGEADDSYSIREAVKAGCREYLVTERLREELSEAFEKIESQEGLPSQRGPTIALFSPSGGVGVSTTAVNLAVRLAKGKPGQVALIDMKPPPGDLALLLHLEPQHTLDQICRDWQRIDRKTISQAVVTHRTGLHVLAQRGYPNQGGLPDNTLSRHAVRQTITLLRRMYATTVLDLDHAINETQLEAMRLSTIVAMVVRADVTGLQRARWAMRTIEGFGLGRDRFRLVLNRFGGKGQIAVAKAEEMLGIEVLQSIPEDRSAVNRAVNQGVPLAELSRCSRITRSISSLARSVQS